VCVCVCVCVCECVCVCVCVCVRVLCGRSKNASVLIVRVRAGVTEQDVLRPPSPIQHASDTMVSVRLSGNK
jgi:hypothetical protein